jgi:alkylation response protein AidB-like acyl-CoA dehydrogenase
MRTPSRRQRQRGQQGQQNPKRRKAMQQAAHARQTGIGRAASARAVPWAKGRKAKPLGQHGQLC